MTQSLTSSQQKFLDRVDTLMFFFFCVLIYFLPISIALVESFSGVVIFLYLVKKFALSSFAVKDNDAPFRKKIGLIWQKLLPRDNMLNMPIMLFLLAVLASVLMSQVPDISWRAFINKIIEQCFLYFSFIECMKTKKRISWFLLAYLVSMIIVSLSGLVQYVYGQDFLRGIQIYNGRVSSSLRHANDFGALIVMGYGIFLLLTMTKFEKVENGYPKPIDHEQNLIHYLKQGSLWASMLLLICLGLTFSRGTWIGFFVSFIFLITRRKKNIIFLMIIFVCFIYIFNPLMVKKRNVSFFTDNVQSQNEYIARVLEKNKSSVDHQVVSEANDNSSGAWHSLDVLSKFFVDGISGMGGMGRIGFWKEAFNIIKDYPFFGAGLNTYSRIVHQYIVNWGGYPHNCYLQMAAEIGIVGLLSFLLMMFVLFRNSLLFLKTNKDIFSNIVVLGCLVGLYGFLTQSFFDTTLYSLQLGNLMWIVMGLIVAVQMLPKEPGV